MQNKGDLEYSAIMMNAMTLSGRMNSTLVIERVTQIAPSTRVAPAPSLDPEQVSLCSLWNLLCKAESDADALEAEFGVMATLTGPREVHLDLAPEFIGSCNQNYSSVWDD